MLEQHLHICIGKHVCPLTNQQTKLQSIRRNITANLFVMLVQFCTISSLTSPFLVDWTCEHSNYWINETHFGWIHSTRSKHFSIKTIKALIKHQHYRANAKTIQFPSHHSNWAVLAEISNSRPARNGNSFKLSPAVQSHRNHRPPIGCSCNCLFEEPPHGMDGVQWLEFEGISVPVERALSFSRILKHFFVSFPFFILLTLLFIFRFPDIFISNENKEKNTGINSS